MTRRRGRKATIEVKASYLSEVRSRLAIANLKIWKEEPSKDGSVALYFSQLTEDEYLRLLNTVPLDAYTRTAAGVDPNSPFIPESVRQSLLQSTPKRD